MRINGCAWIQFLKPSTDVDEFTNEREYYVQRTKIFSLKHTTETVRHEQTIKLVRDTMLREIYMQDRIREMEFNYHLKRIGSTQNKNPIQAQRIFPARAAQMRNNFIRR